MYLLLAPPTPTPIHWGQLEMLSNWISSRLTSGMQLILS